VLGALVMRGALIAVGATLLAAVHWVFYVFGVFLIVTGVRMALHRQTEVHPGANPLVRLARRMLPITDGYEGQRFIVRRGARRWTTPLLIALLLLESTDLLFALDSIPAIFAVTADPFLVYTSNVFAILGLRSLYFLLAGSVRRFRYLRFGLAAVLVFVGGKMLASDLVHVPIAVSLAVIALILVVTVGASLLVERKQQPGAPSASEPGAADADAAAVR